MKPVLSGCLRLERGTLLILDQGLLPHREVWQRCDDVDTLIALMRRLAIRGAPAIGVCAALLLAVLAERGIAPEQLRADALRLRHARPTAYNLMNSIDRLLPLLTASDYPRSLVAEAEHIHDEDVQSCARMASLGAALIGDSEKILTHCNTGALATTGCGTAFGVISKAQQEGKRPFVWVAETRPLLQGGRLTAWECLREGIDHQIICDSAAPSLMRQRLVHRVFVGSDRIAANGDFANKIGTYALAVAARYHEIPFYVVAPVTTVDPDCPHGEAIPVEQRDPEEIKGVRGAFGCCTWAPEGSPAANPAFDITPAGLVTAWILDSGVYLPDEIGRVKWWQTKGERP